MYLDFKVDPGASFSQQIPSHWNSFIYILNGSGLFGPSGKAVKARKRQTVLLSNNCGDSIQFKNEDSQQLEFVLIAGQPLNEPGNYKKIY